MKKPAPTKLARRAEKLEAKRKAVADWMAADQFMTTGLVAMALIIGAVFGWALHGWVQ